MSDQRDLAILGAQKREREYQARIAELEVAARGLLVALGDTGVGPQAALKAWRDLATVLGVMVTETDVAVPVVERGLPIEEEDTPLIGSFTADDIADWLDDHLDRDGAVALLDFLRGDCMHRYRDADGECDLCGDSKE